MLRKYLSDIAFMQVLNLLIKPIWILVIDREVQNALSQEDYGNYFALFNYALMFFILLDIGLTSFNITVLSRDPKKVRKLAGNIIGIKILLIAVYLLVVFSVGVTLGYDSKEFALLGVLCIMQIITSFNQYFRSIVVSHQQFKADGVFMVLDRFIVVILVALLIWGNLSFVELNIDTFIYAQLIGVAFVFLSLIIYLLPKLKNVKIDFGLKHIFPILKLSWPFALLITLMGLYNYVDSVMLKYLVGNAEAGEYAMGYRLFYSLLMFAQIFSGVLLPFFSKHNKDRATTRVIASYTFKLLLGVGITVAMICYAYQTEIMEALYPLKANTESNQAFSILMFGFIGSAMVLVYGTLLTAHRKLRVLNIAAFATLVLNLIVNSILIPKYGSSGAATATVISQVVFGAACLLTSFKKFNFSITKKEFVEQFVAIVIVVLSIGYLKQYISDPVVHFIVITATVLLAAYLFKLFKKKQFDLLRK